MLEDFTTGCCQVWRASEHSVGGTQQKDLRRRVHQIRFQVPTIHCCVGFQEAKKLYAHDLHKQCWGSESYGTVPVPIVTYPEAALCKKNNGLDKKFEFYANVFPIFYIIFTSSSEWRNEPGSRKQKKAAVDFQRILIWNVSFFPHSLNRFFISRSLIRTNHHVFLGILKIPVICLGRTLVALMSWAGTEGSPPRL